MSIAHNIQHLQTLLPAHVRLVAVSKTKPVSDLMEAYTAGQRDFGENKFKKWYPNGKNSQKISNGI